MADRYDVIVIGGGLGGLTAAVLVAQAGRRTLLIERNRDVGGAASTYKIGNLVVESFHVTSDPRDPADPKHHILTRLGVLKAVDWIPTGAVYEVRGGPVGEPFVLPQGFAKARRALMERFPSARAGISSVCGDMERIATGLGTLSKGLQIFRNPTEVLFNLPKLGLVVKDWRLSVAERFERSFANKEAVKCALGADLGYYHDHLANLWWIFFALGQGGLIGSGGCYVRGGSQRLSDALARAFKSAGGEILLGRAVTQISIDRQDRPLGVTHEVPEGGERVSVRTPVVICNAAPAVVTDMLPPSARERFWAPYAGLPLSISAFSLSLGLSTPPAELGLRTYITFLLPKWMKRLADYRKFGQLMSGMPGDTALPMVVVDYSAIDSGLGGPPYPVTVAGVDRTENWSGLDETTYEAKRDMWREAMLRTIDCEFPGFAAKVVASAFHTANTISTYLNAPGGAIYGFAPQPPSRPIWRGFERSPTTPIRGLYLASTYAFSGGFTGAIMAGATAADQVLAGRSATPPVCA